MPFLPKVVSGTIQEEEFLGELAKPGSFGK